jgi:hypothetical protein
VKKIRREVVSAAALVSTILIEFMGKPSKALSMKRLYQMAGEHLVEKYKGSSIEGNDISMTLPKREMDIINSYLRYVWEHRND